MLHDIVKKGAVDRSVTVRIIDSTDGTPETGVVWNTAGIDLWYRREGAAVVSITEATLAALTTAHTDGGFLTISHGYYRLDLPDAAFATGANHVDFGGTVTGMVVIGGRVRLVDYDPEDTVRMGLTALPNAAAEAAGGLYTRGTGAGQIAQDANGNIRSNLDTIKTQAVTCAAGVTVLASVGTAATSTAQTGDSFPLVSTEVAEIYAAVITNAAGVDIAADIIAVKTDTAAILVDTGTTLDGRIPAALVGGKMDASVGAVAVGVDLSATMKTSVNAEVVDAISVDAQVELATIPATTAPLNKMIQYIFQYLRNRRSFNKTTGVETLYKEDALTSLGTSTSTDDGTTFDKGEVG